MARKGNVRDLITLGCEDCKERTYHTTKNKRNDPNRIELKKYCPRCRSHHLFRAVSYTHLTLPTKA